MKFLTAALVLAAIFIPKTSAYVGWDGIQAVSESGFRCLWNSGFRFYVARVWESIGNYDFTGIQNIKNARAAGWADVDGYIFPCHRSYCASPEAQVEATVHRLQADGAKFGMLWLDIERQDWPADKTQNRNFIQRMMNQLEKMKINYGVYTNNYNWESIVGIDWAGAAHRPLWWANYNGHQGYEGFVPFGGWKKPSIHQYNGDVKGPCGVNMDLNYYP